MCVRHFAGLGLVLLACHSPPPAPVSTAPVNVGVGKSPVEPPVDAAELLWFANAAFQDGCAPFSAPRNIPWTNLGPRVDEPHPSAPLFAHNGDARTKLAAAPAAKPGCAMLP